MARKKPDPDFALGEAALRLAATHGWQKITLEQIAKAAKLPLAPIQKRYADRNALLPLIVKMVSAESRALMGKPDKIATTHDRLFEIMMARFDVLQKYRKGVLSIFPALRFDPRASLILAASQIEAMKETLNWAQLTFSPACQKPAAIALWSVFCMTCHAWKNDETLDMSRTMAILDRNLRYANKISMLLSLNAG